MSDSVRLAVVSHACVRAINRKVYAALQGYGFDVHIIVPEKILRGQSMVHCEPPAEADPPLHHLRVSGSNLRTLRYEGQAG